MERAAREELFTILSPAFCCHSFSAQCFHGLPGGHPHALPRFSFSETKEFFIILHDQLQMIFLYDGP